MKVFRRVLSIFLLIIVISQTEIALKSDSDVFFIVAISAFQLGVAYLLWPRSYNSLVQFGYSYDLVEDLAELDFLKSKIDDNPEFKIWVGDYLVIAYNKNITEEKFAVAKLKQFTKAQLEILSPQTTLTYHSFDKKGIWFEVITDEKLKRFKKKPYPFK